MQSTAAHFDNADRKENSLQNGKRREIARVLPFMKFESMMKSTTIECLYTPANDAQKCIYLNLLLGVLKTIW